MGTSDDWIAPRHDPFQGPDAEDEADARERLLDELEDSESIDRLEELGRADELEPGP